MKMGFIGQGWIGKNYADDFEERGFQVVRYGLEPELALNKGTIAECGIVFIAVPTPTRPDTGFDASIVESAITLVGEGRIAVIKSTIVPGTTDALQKRFPHCFLIHAPEFLTKKTAAHDARHPTRNIIGVTDVSRDKAQEVLDVLPKAPYEAVLPARAAELIKYASNVFLTTKVIFANLFYDISQTLGVDYEEVKKALIADPRVGSTHLDVSHDGGRGAGGMCFIKDLAAFRQWVEDGGWGDTSRVLRELEAYNLSLLRGSGKNLDAIQDVYGTRSDS